MKNGTNVPEKSISGSDWERFTFEQFAQSCETKGEPYKVDTWKILRQLLKNVCKEVGLIRGSYIFFKSLFLDMIFNKPKWMPEKFDIKSEAQGKFYLSKFNEYVIFIIFFNNLKKVIGEKKADTLMANQMLPIVLEMMKERFTPVEKIDSVEVWLEQARDYLGDEIEKNKGFTGNIYLAKDKTEMHFHVTRCATVQIIREYGLKYTAAALCMGDHITYHTVFPNLIFKRCHNLSVGDCFCDHEFRLRTNNDPTMYEENYGDCYRIDGMRDLVREWEEKAKEIYFGSKENWNKYASKYFKKS